MDPFLGKDDLILESSWEGPYTVKEITVLQYLDRSHMSLHFPASVLSSQSYELFLRCRTLCTHFTLHQTANETVEYTENSIPFFQVSVIQ